MRLSGFRSTIVEPPVAPADLAGVLGGDEGLAGKITGNFAKSEPIGASVAEKRVATTTA